MRSSPLAVLSCALLLASCGGGGDSPSSNASITGLSIRMADDAAAALRYGGVAVVTASGSGLAGAALTFSGAACLWADAPAGFVDSDTERHRQCTLQAVGAQTLAVSPSGGAIARSLSFDLPLPQVTMSIASNGAAVGDLVFTLDPSKAPITVDNFLRYVHEGFYDGTAFHRHAPGFVMQGGGYAAPVGTTSLPALKPTHDPIVLETTGGLSNLRYTVAMARTAVANSATSQFYVNLADNIGLDGPTGYAVFGTLGTRSAVLDAMVAAPCAAAAWLSAGECVPLPNLVVSQARQTR